MFANSSMSDIWQGSNIPLHPGAGAKCYGGLILFISQSRVSKLKLDRLIVLGLRNDELLKN